MRRIPATDHVLLWTVCVVAVVADCVDLLSSDWQRASGAEPVRQSAASTLSASTEKRQTVVRVVPVDLKQRLADEAPAELVISKSDLPTGRRINLESLAVHRYDLHSEKELSGPLPSRWYDDSIPYEFPECEQNVHATDGITLTFTPRPRWGELYNLLGEGKGGRIVWIHRQEGTAVSHYLVKFQLLAEGLSPEKMPSRGFVGDGSHRCRVTGASSTGMIHSRVAIADWNGDGLLDLLVGGARGNVIFYSNRGTRTQPRFPLSRLVLTQDGKPLDVGWSAAPLAVDWDGDGVTDLLCGGERNRLLYFRNLGTNRDPALVNHGFVRVEGEPLAVPIEPVPKSAPGIYTLDYYPVVDVVDWNGDGRPDLLAGGYVTGRIFFYENSGKEPDGTPKLVPRGPLETEGHPLNVGDWAAAPCVADFDGDGDLDLMSGNMAITTGGGDSSDREHFLRYYENTGSRTVPKLVERPFPKSGVFPDAVLGTPRAADFNGDGLLDLIVSAGENLFLWMNQGTRQKPDFAVSPTALACEWGSVPLPTFGLQFLDVDGDGTNEILSGLSIFKNSGNGNYVSSSLLPAGNMISHPPPRGDGWTFTQLADLNGDGRLDILYGTHEGHIWLHRNVGGNPARYDEGGTPLEFAAGGRLHVGPNPGQALDFDVLQGARTTFTVADFDADGILDLVAGDTYGKVRYFHNVGTRREPRFASPVELGDMKIRMTPYAVDWDRDGNMDVVGSAAGGAVAVWRGLGTGRFADSQVIPVPAVAYSPFAAVVDWNQDGDDDLIIGTAYGYFCWFERSFLDRGYAKAERVP